MRDLWKHAGSFLRQRIAWRGGGRTLATQQWTQAPSMKFTNHRAPVPD